LRRSETPRLLIVPGLDDSGPAHWQTWLQSLHRDAIRVQQEDWSVPDLERWAARIGEAVARHGGPLIAAAHSFGCLALVRHLARRPDSPIASALLVAPADPARFRAAPVLASQAIDTPTLVVASDTDPWMSARDARHWAHAWRSRFVNLGDVGHINVDSGFGPLPLAARWVDGARRRAARLRRFETAAPREGSFAS